MSIIADRGLFVRLLVQSGRFDAPGAESFADAVDATTREPASKADLMEVRNELKADLAFLTHRFDLLEKWFDARFAAQGDRLMVRLGGLGLAVAGLLFAALRLT